MIDQNENLLWIDYYLKVNGYRVTRANNRRRTIHPYFQNKDTLNLQIMKINDLYKLLKNIIKP